MENSEFVGCSLAYRLAGFLHVQLHPYCITIDYRQFIPGLLAREVVATGFRAPSHLTLVDWLNHKGDITKPFHRAQSTPFSNNYPFTFHHGDMASRNFIVDTRV